LLNGGERSMLFHSRPTTRYEAHNIVADTISSRLFTNQQLI
jgi:hypothetical protein